MNYLAVGDFTSYNPSLDTSAYTSTTLSGIISRVESAVDNYLGFSLNLQTVTNEKARGYINEHGSLVIHPKYRPVSSVSALSLVAGTDTITLVLTDDSGNTRYDVDSDGFAVIYKSAELSTTGTSTLASFSDLRGGEFWTKMTYIAGYETIPGDILQAVDLLTKSQLAKNQNVGGASRIRQGNVDITYSESGMDEYEKDAFSILDRYKRVTPF